eukprot:1005424-Pelagomonas_calceolata.AAC.1
MGPLLPGHGRVFSSASHFNHLATATRFQLRNTGLHQPRKTKDVSIVFGRYKHMILGMEFGSKMELRAFFGNLRRNAFRQVPYSCVCANFGAGAHPE